MSAALCASKGGESEMARLTSVVSLDRSKAFSHMEMWVEDEGTCATCGTTEGPFIVAHSRHQQDLADAEFEQGIRRLMQLEHLTREQAVKFLTEPNVGCFPCTVDALVETGGAMAAAEIQKQAQRDLLRVLQSGGIPGPGGMPQGAAVHQASAECDYEPGGYL